MIVSAADKNRFDCDINHLKYAQSQNVNYKFYNDLKINDHYYFIKIHAILDALENNDHVLYLDDDAFFTRTDWNYKTILKEYSTDIIVARSPNKPWFKKTPAIFNSGVMFFKKTNQVISLLQDVLEKPDYEWKTDWGNQVGGDQDILIYLTQTKYKGIASIIEQTKINARHYDYEGELYPIVHFAGKDKPIKEFCNNICDLYNL